MFLSEAVFPAESYGSMQCVFAQMQHPVCVCTNAAQLRHHPHVRAYMHACVCACMRACVRTCMRACVHVGVRVCAPMQAEGSEVQQQSRAEHHWM